jgi:hypothetical protein
MKGAVMIATLTNSPESKLSKFSQWVRRHRNFYSLLMVMPPTILGALPGLAMLLFLSPMQAHHILQTIAQVILWGMAGIALMTFGSLFGVFVGCMVLIMEKFVSPELFPSEQ